MEYMYTQFEKYANKINIDKESYQQLMLKRLNIILFQRSFTSVICNPKENNSLYKQLKFVCKGGQDKRS